MKTLCFIICSLFVYFSCFSAIPVDSLEKRLKTVEVQLKMLKQISDEEDNDYDEPYLKVFSNIGKNFQCKHKLIKFKSDRCCPNRASHLSFLQKLYVLSPILLVFFALFIFFLSLKKIDFSLKNSLSDYNAEKEIYIPSFIKLITFIAIIVAIIIAAIIVSAYMYYIFSGKAIPRFVGLWPVVVIIGLSILPYFIREFFNK